MNAKSHNFWKIMEDSLSFIKNIFYANPFNKFKSFVDIF